MFGLGATELLIVLVLVLFFYGGKRLPQIGDGLGRGIREFKRAIKGTEHSAGESKTLQKQNTSAGPKSQDRSGDDAGADQDTRNQT